MSADPKSLLTRGLVIISREMERMETPSPADPEGKPPPLLTTQVQDLCAYMNVLKTLVGKDIGGDDNTTEYTEEELREEALLLFKGIDDEGGTGNSGRPSRAKRGKRK